MAEKNIPTDFKELAGYISNLIKDGGNDNSAVKNAIGIFYDLYKKKEIVDNDAYYPFVWELSRMIESEQDSLLSDKEKEIIFLSISTGAALGLLVGRYG